jgi:hypothetical protein
VILEADLMGRQGKRRPETVIRRGFSRVLREERRVELGEWRPVRAGLDAHAQHAGARFEHHQRVAIAAGLPPDAALGQVNRRADRGVSGERQLHLRREDTDRGGVRRPLRRQHEYGFGKVEFPGYRLHGIGVEPVGILDHGQGVAALAFTGEDVQNCIAPFHQTRTNGCISASFTRKREALPVARRRHPSAIRQVI